MSPVVQPGLPLDRIREIVDAALASSTADETEIAWVEHRSRRAEVGPGASQESRFERTVEVRVVDRGRLGSHRTEAESIAELEKAVRYAQAASRGCEALAGLQHLPVDGGEAPEPPGLSDGRLVDLGRKEAAAILSALAGPRERAALSWRDGRVLVANSRGLRRRAAVTSIDAEVWCSRQPGGGWAAESARSLQDLDLPALVERARERDVRGTPGDLPAEAPRLLFSPEATGDLLRALRDEAFSARSYVSGHSFLREHSGVQVFDHSVHLVDDATDPRALPFPFDLEGTAKRAADLIEAGTPRTPALDHRQGATLGLQTTGHAVGGGEARPENMILMPGPLGADELLEGADGGLFIPRLVRVECFDPRRMLIRFQARGARLVGGRQLGPGLPDLVWEGSLLRMLADLEGLGRTPIARSQGSAILGGIAAPASLIRCGTVPRPVPEAG